MNALLALLGAAALWLATQLLLSLVGEAIFLLLAPILRPIERFLGRLVTGWTVSLLWVSAFASYVFFVHSLGSSRASVHVLGIVLFMSATPIALLTTYLWRDALRARQNLQRPYTAG